MLLPSQINFSIPTFLNKKIKQNLHLSTGSSIHSTFSWKSEPVSFLHSRPIFQKKPQLGLPSWVYPRVGNCVQSGAFTRQDTKCRSTIPTWNHFVLESGLKQRLRMSKNALRVNHRILNLAITGTLQAKLTFNLVNDSWREIFRNKDILWNLRTKLFITMKWMSESEFVYKRILCFWKHKMSFLLLTTTTFLAGFFFLINIALKSIPPATRHWEVSLVCAISHFVKTHRWHINWIRAPPSRVRSRFRIDRLLKWPLSAIIAGLMAIANLRHLA